MGKRSRSYKTGSHANKTREGAGDVGARRQRRRTADVLHTGLDALPTELLHNILHRVGRPARLVSRHWRATCGPPCGLYLRHIATRSDLCRTVPPSSPLARIHALFLGPCSPSYTFSRAVLASLPVTFPTLRSLHLMPHTAVRAPQAHLLARLAPHLTSLVLCLQTPASATHLPTSLRALTLRTGLTPSPPSATMVAFLTALAHLLPTLHQFDYHSPLSPVSTCGIPAPAILTHLAAMSQVTQLHLAAQLIDWDRPSLELLRTCWPHLVSLQLDFHSPLPQAFAIHGWQQAATRLNPPTAAPATPRDVLAALATRTRLTSLALNTSLLSFGPLPALPHLSSFELTAGRRPFFYDELAALLDADGRPSPLTRLAIANCRLVLSRPLLATFARLAATLRHLALSVTVESLSHIEPIASLTALRRLHLELSPRQRADRPPYPHASPPEAVAHAVGAALTHLTSLTLSPTLLWPFEKLVEAAAAHGRLRHLSVTSYLPGLAASLAPVRATLARLSFSVHHVEVIAALKLLSALDALLGLSIAVQHLHAEYYRIPAHDLLALGPALGPAQVPGGMPTASCSGSHPTSAGAGAASTSAAAAPTTTSASDSSTRAAAEAHPAALDLERLLPPRLRFLHADLDRLPAGQRQQLLAAAARQGCEVRARLRLDEYEDCNGYLDGADPAFFRRG